MGFWINPQGRAYRHCIDVGYVRETETERRSGPTVARRAGSDPQVTGSKEMCLSDLLPQELSFADNLRYLGVDSMPFEGPHPINTTVSA